jgi:hypothetical protein
MTKGAGVRNESNIAVEFEDVFAYKLTDYRGVILLWTNKVTTFACSAENWGHDIPTALQLNQSNVCPTLIHLDFPLAVRIIPYFLVMQYTKSLY